MDINSVSKRNPQETNIYVKVLTFSPGFFPLTTSPKCQNSIPCHPAFVPPNQC